MNKNNQAIIDFLLKSNDMDVSKYDVTFLNKTVNKRMKETLCETEEGYYKHLEQNGMEGDLFLHALEISYTEFFRNPLTFSVLEKIIIPTLVRNKSKSPGNEIRIWSAACAGGQETYSLAMLLNEFSISLGHTINFRIFATDQSQTVIDEAKQGRYPQSALNGLTLKRLNQWFTKSGDMNHVKPQLQENIDFSVFDLLDKQHSSPPASIFGDFDMVMCANLLFYYKPEYRKRIIDKTTHSLSKNGYLITGDSEREILLQHNFQEVFPHSAIFQERET